MARTVVDLLSQGKLRGQSSFDRIRHWLFALHVGIIIYVALGWLITWRAGLYFYTLLLPMIALQWLLNGGCSIVTNVENLLLTGRWDDPENRSAGNFFSTLLRAAGVRANTAQITTALCSLMLIFWVCAICRMMLVVPGK